MKNETITKAFIFPADKQNSKVLNKLNSYLLKKPFVLSKKNIPAVVQQDIVIREITYCGCHVPADIQVKKNQKGFVVLVPFGIDLDKVLPEKYCGLVWEDLKKNVESIKKADSEFFFTEAETS